MEHARDSFLKYLASRLTLDGVKLATDPQDGIAANTVAVFFLSTGPKVTMNPGLNEMVVSLDVLAAGTETETAPHRAMTMASAVDRALSGGWIKKQDWTDPAHPVDLGTFMSWRPWGSWRRVPEPNERFAHLNRTISLMYLGEQV